MQQELVKMTDKGMYCPLGDFYIDPQQPVRYAVITHGHGDHLRHGSRHYLTANPGKGVLQLRLGRSAPLQTLEYGEKLVRNGVTISFHPAGHILGSAQVRIAYKGEIWCISGDYKIEPDPTCAPFEQVRCHTFVTESTFGHPRFVWPDQNKVLAEINAWWRMNKSLGITSIILSYALGKAQRILAGLDTSIGPVYGHAQVEEMNRVYRRAGIPLPETLDTLSCDGRELPDGALLIIPPHQRFGHWLRWFRPNNIAMCSGWMLLPESVKERQVDCGFVISDHADWPGLLHAIKGSGAENVIVMHGEGTDLVQHLSVDLNIQARQFLKRQYL
jgi:putative mRNA 3-end processing factor